MKQMRLTTMAAYMCWLGMSVMVFSDWLEDDFSDSGYENTIIAVDEFATSTGQKIMVRFEHDDPICTYTPQSFAESIDNTVYRVSMPRTKVADGVSCSYDMQESEEGVELILTGTSFKKIICGNVVFFVIGQQKS